MRTEGIKSTIIKQFFDNNEFTLSSAVRIVKKEMSVNDSSIRGRLYEMIKSGNLERCKDPNGKIIRGVYRVVKNDTTTLLVQGNGRDLSFINDHSIDAIVTDHPYEDKKAHQGGNRNFTSEYECFKYQLSDFQEKFRVLKAGAFLIEFIPEESATNFEYLYELKKMAVEAGFSYYTKVPWKKGALVSNTGRKKKNKEELVFFSKGEPRHLKADAKKNKATALANNIDIKGKNAKEIIELLKSNDLPLSYMKGTNGMLPTEFIYDPLNKKERLHQAEKPVGLFIELMSYIVKKGETVLDQFCGSSSVGEACMLLGLNCILVENKEEHIRKSDERLGKLMLG